MEIMRGRYRHFKGKEYEVVGVARHSETLEDHVIYRPLYESESAYWIRPLAMFFELVEHEGKVVPRFAYIGEAAAR
jgi:cyclomaltodextrinase